MIMSNKIIVFHMCKSNERNACRLIVSFSINSILNFIEVKRIVVLTEQSASNRKLPIMCLTDNNRALFPVQDILFSVPSDDQIESTDEPQ